ILGACFSAAISFAQNTNKTPETDTRDGLKFSIRLVRETYNIKDNPELKITFTNVGKSPITVYKKISWGVRSSLLAFIRDSSGKLIEPDSVYEAADRPPFRAEDFKTINPGESFEVGEELFLADLRVVEAGTYQISVSYESPVLQAYAPKLPGLVWVNET